MAVSNSIDFNLNLTQLLVAARRKAGIHADEEAYPVAEFEADTVTLNLMLKAWQAKGVLSWTMAEGSLTLVQGQAAYVFGSGGDVATVPMDIRSARIVRASIDTPMLPLSRERYLDLPNKTTQGFPTQFYYDRQRASGTLYVWPAPDATAGTLKYAHRRRIMDMDAAADDFDVPQEWYEATLYNLAERLLEDYGLSGTREADKISLRAATAFAEASSFDAADGESALTIRPDDY